MRPPALCAQTVWGVCPCCLLCLCSFRRVRIDHVGFGLVLGDDGKKFRSRSGDVSGCWCWGLCFYDAAFLLPLLPAAQVRLLSLAPVQCAVTAAEGVHCASSASGRTRRLPHAPRGAATARHGGRGATAHTMAAPDRGRVAAASRLPLVIAGNIQQSPGTIHCLPACMLLWNARTLPLPLHKWACMSGHAVDRSCSRSVLQPIGPAVDRSCSRSVLQSLNCFTVHPHHWLHRWCAWLSCWTRPNAASWTLSRSDGEWTVPNNCAALFATAATTCCGATGCVDKEPYCAALPLLHCVCMGMRRCFQVQGAHEAPRRGGNPWRLPISAAANVRC